MSLFMDGLTDGHYLHSYVLLFLCLYLLLPSALAGIVLLLRLDPWSWPGMTASRALVQNEFCKLKREACLTS